MINFNGLLLISSIVLSGLTYANSAFGQSSEQEVKVLKTEISLLKSEIQSLRTLVSDLSKDHISNRGDVKARMDGIERVLNTFPLATMWNETQLLNKTVFQDQQARLTILETNMSTVQNRISTLDNKQSILEADMHAVSSQLAMLNVEFKNFIASEWPILEQRLLNLEHDLRAWIIPTLIEAGILEDPAAEKPE